MTQDNKTLTPQVECEQITKAPTTEEVCQEIRETAAYEELIEHEDIDSVALYPEENDGGPDIIHINIKFLIKEESISEHIQSAWACDCRHFKHVIRFVILCRKIITESGFFFNLVILGKNNYSNKIEQLWGISKPILDLCDRYQLSKLQKEMDDIQTSNTESMLIAVAQSQMRTLNLQKNCMLLLSILVAILSIKVFS